MFNIVLINLINEDVAKVIKYLDVLFIDSNYFNYLNVNNINYLNSNDY